MNRQHPIAHPDTSTSEAGPKAATGVPTPFADALPDALPDGGEPGAKGRAVLVVGPEGAGVALAAGVLGLLGCDLPRDLVAVGATDGRGAWGSEAIDAACRPDPAAAGWPAPGGASAAGDREAAVATAFGDATLPLLVGAGLLGDLPGWRAALRRTGRGMVALLVHGLPDEGADDDAWVAWTEAAIRAEAGTRGLRRAVATRDGLGGGWRAEAGRIGGALGLAWPARDSAEAAVDSFVAGAAPAAPAASPRANAAGRSAARVAAILARWAEAGEDPADHAALDRIALRSGLWPASSGLAEAGVAVGAGTDPEPPDGAMGFTSSDDEDGAGGPGAGGLGNGMAETSGPSAADLLAALDARLARALEDLDRAERRRLDEVAALEDRSRRAEEELAVARHDLGRRGADAPASAEPADAEELATLRHRRDHLESALRQRSLEAEEAVAQRTEAERRLDTLFAEVDRLRAEQAADRAALARSRRDLAILRRDAIEDVRARISALTGPAARGALGGLDPADRAERDRLLVERAERDRLLAEREGEVTHLRTALATANARAEKAGAQWREMRASTSWRVTAPLRRIVQALRRIAQALRRG